LTWTDSTGETSYVVERATNGGAFAPLAPLAADGVAHTDATVPPATPDSYRVQAVNLAGSAFSNTITVTVPARPASPTNLVLTPQGALPPTGPRMRLVFRDNANGAIPETGFIVYRGVNGGALVQLATLPARGGVGNVTYFDTTVVAGNTYAYQVLTVNGPTPSASPSNTAIGTVPPAPAAPATFTATTQVTGGGTTARVNLTWTDSSNNESRFVVQRATDAGFTANLFTSNRGANTTTWSNGNLPRGATLYYRIRAENTWGVSAWVTLAPFPITTPSPARPATESGAACAPRAPRQPGLALAPAGREPGPRLLGHA
jgi:titin